MQANQGVVFIFLSHKESASMDRTSGGSGSDGDSLTFQLLPEAALSSRDRFLSCPAVSDQLDGGTWYSGARGRPLRRLGRTFRRLDSSCRASLTHSRQCNPGLTPISQAVCGRSDRAPLDATRTATHSEELDIYRAYAHTELSHWLQKPVAEKQREMAALRLRPTTSLCSEGRSRYSSVSS